MEWCRNLFEIEHIHHFPVYLDLVIFSQDDRGMCRILGIRDEVGLETLFFDLLDRRESVYDADVGSCGIALPHEILVDEDI